MSSLGQTEALNRMHLAVKELAGQLDAVGALPHESLRDLKSAVDDIRLRLWGILMAANSEDYQGFSERFRLARATEICQGILEDAAADRLTLTSKEAGQLGVATRELGRRITAAHSRG